MTGHVEVHHTMEGRPDGPVVVLSNSLGTTSALWDPQMPALAERFRVIRYDLRGHGRSPVPPGPYDIADLGADLVALLDRLGIGRANACGISLGGAVAMWTAANAPDRIDRLVLCTTSPRFGPPEAWAERAAMVRSMGTAAIADVVVARWFTPGFIHRRPGLVARMREMLVGTPPEGYAGCCDALVRMDLRPHLGAVRAPTLVIAAAQDPAAPPEHAHRIADGVGDGRVTIVQDAAHLANVERPEEITRAMMEHLSDP